MERPSQPVPLVRVDRSDRHVTAAIVVTAVLLVAAVVKPWASRDAPLRPMADPTAAPAPATITSSPVAAAVEAAVVPAAAAEPAECWPTTGWRLVDDARFLDRTVRSWTAVQASPARDPLDPSIPLVRLVSAGVLRLGFCAPVTADVVPGRAWRATVWRIGTIDGSSTARPFGPVARMTAPPGLDGAMASAPPDMRRSAASWPPGRYVLEVHDAVTPGADAWFGVDIVSSAP